MRHTDQDWKIIGDSEPYFGVLSNERYLKKNITPQVLKEFYATGEADINHAKESLNILSQTFRPATALDFGCGVGRLLAALATQVDFTYGVDISTSMLKLLNEHLTEMGVSNYEVFTEIPEFQVDWVNSLIVLQHIPPDIGYELIRKLWGAVKPEGGFSIHFPIYRDREHLHEIFRDVNVCAYDGEFIRIFHQELSSNPGSMTMYDYDFAKVLSILDPTDGAKMLIEHVNHGGCHGIKLYAIKSL